MYKIRKKDLIAFEDEVKRRFENGEIPYPIHFSGGNEEQLISIFNEVQQNDWVFSTHRSHYHYLLKGGSPDKLMEMIMRGDSLHVFDKSINFVSSAIVCGTPSMAVGVAKSLQLEKSDAFVWCFIGDGAEEQGAFYEAVRYADSKSLPCIFVIEDNNLSVDTPKNIRSSAKKFPWPSNVIRYEYVRKYPHVQTGKMISHYM